MHDDDIVDAGEEGVVDAAEHSDRREADDGSGIETEDATADGIDDGPAEVRDVRGDWTPPDYGPPPPASCGDGVLDPVEECDDGNRMDGDGCDWRCLAGDGETPEAPPDPAAGRLSGEVTVTPVEGGEPMLLAGPLMDRLPVVWAADSYAVVWTPSLSSDDSPGTVQAAFLRIDTSGRLRGAGWEYDFGSFWTVMALAWTGSGFGLALGGPWETTVELLLLDANGKPVSGPVVIGHSPLGTFSLALAWDGAGFAALWNHLYDEPSDARSGLQFVQAGPDGEARGPGPVVPAPDDVGRAPVAVAWSGSSYLAVWGEESRDERASPVRYALFDEGGVLAIGPRTLGRFEGALLDAVWAGDRFAIMWVAREDAMLHVARFAADGTLLGPPTAGGSGRASILAAGVLASAVGADSLAAAWVDGDPDVNLVLARFDLEGTFIEEVFLSPRRDGVEHLPPPIGMAFDGSAFGVVGAYAEGPVLIRREVER